MDKNTIIGLFLMLGLVFAMTYFNQPSDEEIAADNALKAAVADSLRIVQEQQLAAAQASQPQIIETPEITTLDSAQAANMAAQLNGTHGIFGRATIGDEEFISFHNENLEVTLSTKGGLFYSTRLLDGYRTYWDSTEIRLWNEDMSTMGFDFEYPGKGQFSTSDFFFEASNIQEAANEGIPAGVKMKLNTSDPSKYIELIYTLPSNSYEVGFAMNIVGLDAEMNTQGKGIALNWKAAGNHNEKGISLERQRSAVYYQLHDEDRDYLSDGREDEDEFLEDEMHWTAFKQNYFSAIVIADGGFAKGAKIASFPPTDERDTTTTMFFAASLPLKVSAGSNVSVPLRFFFGPNDYKILKDTGVDELHRIIDYGWWIFGWVNRNMIRPVFDFLTNHIASAGIVILILTLLIKLLLSPVTWKNYVSSAKMRVLKPEMDEIAKKYEGKDATEKQAATMALYRETGVNPFAGCLPVLLQMPILYAMFRFFPASIELRGKSFLWADDLGAYDAIVSWSTEIPLISSIYGNHISGFTVLMAASTFFYTRMNATSMPNTQQPGMPNMKVIMNIFPFMMLIFFNKFASGLSLYYFFANVISIGQMVAIKRYFIDEDKIRAKIDANKKKPKKKSNFQSRLEEMQKVQQQQKGKKKK